VAAATAAAAVAVAAVAARIDGLLTRNFATVTQLDVVETFCTEGAG